jgi:hypothetical protein
MPAGRPQKAEAASLYPFAHEFYWDFRSLAEGARRWVYDARKYAQLTEGVDSMQFIREEDQARHQKIVDEEIELGRLDPSLREARLADIADGENMVRRDSYRRHAAEASRTDIKVPPELDVVRVLLNRGTTAEQLRALCTNAHMPRTLNGKEAQVEAWPITPGSTLPMYLSQFAEQYVAALNDRRFPRCDVNERPSTRLKQLWFLSRALAGAVYGVSTRTAINLVGSLRPEQMLSVLRDGKPRRKRTKVRRARTRT